MDFISFIKKHLRQGIVFLSCLIAISCGPLVGYLPMDEATIGISILLYLSTSLLGQFVFPLLFLYERGNYDAGPIFPFSFAIIMTILIWSLTTALFAYLTRNVNSIWALLRRSAFTIFCVVGITHIIINLLGWKVDYVSIGFSP